jgi:hypothetical protein
MLALVAAVASATALYAAWAEYHGDPDTPITLLLAVVLTGLAIGAWRRASPTLVMVQIALACAGLRLAIESEGTRLGNYVLLALFAATVVVPLLIVRALDSPGRESRRRGRIEAVAAVLLNTGLNLVAYVAFLIASFEIGMMPIQISAPSIPTLAVPIPPAPPILPAPPIASTSSMPPLPPGERNPFDLDEPPLTAADESQPNLTAPGYDPLDKLPPMPRPPRIPTPNPAFGPKPKAVPPSSVDPNASPVMPNVLQPIPTDSGSSPLDNLPPLAMPPDTPAPAPRSK